MSGPRFESELIFSHIIKTFYPKILFPQISQIFQDQQNMLNAPQGPQVIISSTFIPGLIEATS